MLTIGRIAELWKLWVEGPHDGREQPWMDGLTEEEREYVESEEERFWASIGGKPRKENEYAE